MARVSAKDPVRISAFWVVRGAARWARLDLLPRCERRWIGRHRVGRPFNTATVAIFALFHLPHGGAVSNEALCSKCLVEGAVIDVGTASGRVHRQCPQCRSIWREKNAAAVAMGRLGGIARANSISKERAEEIAFDAASARWKSEKHNGKRKKFSGQTHTQAEWFALVTYCEYRCVKCGRLEDLQKDHVLPRYQGGGGSIDNLQPLCKRCNAAKGPDSTDYRKPGWRDFLLAAIK